MPRKSKKRGGEEKVTFIRRNVVVEKGSWKAPFLDKFCECEAFKDEQTCLEGCELRQQRRECVACHTGQLCSNRTIQMKDFRPWTVIQCGDRGQGLAFTESVEANVIALEYTGEIISEATARQRLALHPGKPTYTARFLSGWVIDSRVKGSGARFINSSHTPNCVLETWWVGQIPHLVVRTLRRLGALEEATINYDFDADDGELCMCGADNCTGVIGANRVGPPPDPASTNERPPVAKLLSNLSRSCRAVMKRYGLTLIKTPGDGNCLFHAFSELFPNRTMKQWRNAIADDIARIRDTRVRLLYVQRANQDIRRGRAPFRDFDDLIAGIRGSEWGNSDCIRHFSRIVERTVVSFVQGGDTMYHRWQWDSAPREYVFLYNSTCPASGRLVHFDPCRPLGDISQEMLDEIDRLRNIYDVAPSDTHIVIESSGPSRRVHRLAESVIARVQARPDKAKAKLPVPFCSPSDTFGKAKHRATAASGWSKEPRSSDDRALPGARDIAPVVIRTRAEHDTLTEHLATMGMRSRRTAHAGDCFFESVGRIPGHTLSGIPVMAIRQQVAQWIRKRWDESDMEQRSIMLDTMQMGIDEYVRGVERHAWADDLVILTISHLVNGVVSIWSPGPEHRTPTQMRHQSATDTVRLNVQRINVNRDGDLNHYEPLFYEQTDSGSKRVSAKGKRPRDRDGGRDENGSTGGKKIASAPISSRTNVAVMKAARAGKNGSGGCGEATDSGKAENGANVHVEPVQTQLPATSCRSPQSMTAAEGAKRWQEWTTRWRSTTETSLLRDTTSNIDVHRIPFVDKNRKTISVPARSHWGLYYFVFKLQHHRQGEEWDLKALSTMALHPKISKDAAASIWELGWQECFEYDKIPTAGVDMDHGDPFQIMHLWTASHLWAQDCEEGGRSDLVATLANVGPVGIWQSLGSTVSDMADKRPPIIMLGDLRISKLSVASLRSALTSRFPQYRVVISSHSAAEWEQSDKGRVRRKYHYALATLLHRTLYTNVTTKMIHDPKNSSERRAVLGHSQVITATASSIGKRVMVINMYQHTSAFPDRQELLWHCLGRFLDKQDWSDTNLIGGGDLNAAFSSQRSNYKSATHEWSDRVLQDFASSKRVEFVGPSQTTYWNPNGASSATLDHVFVRSSRESKASVTVRHSWNPAHDHGNLYVHARINYLPGRSAVGARSSPQQRVRIKAFERRKWEWGVISDDVMVDMDTAKDYSLSPPDFQNRFKDVIEEVVSAGVKMVGLTSSGTNRPPYRTAEITEMVHRSRMLTAAKREMFAMTSSDVRWTRAQTLALTDLGIDLPALPLQTKLFEAIRTQVCTANSDLLLEIRTVTSAMERGNIRERLEQVREDLGKERFSVQKALGKMSDPGVLDIIEHRIPVGLLFDMTKDELLAKLRDGNLEEAACWAEPTADGSMTAVRAPNLENIVPLLVRTPAHAAPKEVIWGVRTAQEDQLRLWIMDHHYQQISYAKNVRCGGCKAKTPVALPLRLNGDVTVVDYCASCFGVHAFAAVPEEYEDLNFLGGVMDYRRVPEGEAIAGEVPFDVFMKYIGRLREKKAAGLDRFHVEFLKHAATSVHHYVHHLVNLVLTKQIQIDEDFLVGEIRLLFKKEPAHNLRNWRPVCLLKMVYKLVSGIINDRLSVIVEKYHLLEDSQEGFRRSRGTGRQAQSLVWLYQRASRKNMKLYSVMTDFVSAFDSADHPALLRTLRAYNIPDADLIATLYRASPFRVTTGFGTTSTIRVGRGCRQGDILSPAAFDLFVNILLRYVNATGVGAYITDDRKVNHKSFADDISFVTHNLEDMQLLLSRMERFCEWSGMEVNMLKTKATAIDYATGKVPDDLGVRMTNGAVKPSNERPKARNVCNLTFDGDNIDFVAPTEPMTYLGYDLTLTGCWKAEIAKVKAKTLRLVNVLHKHKFTESQGRYLFQCSAVATFRYSVAVAQWPESDLRSLTYMWARAYKNANHLMNSVARSLILCPSDMGGEQLATPFSVALKEVGSHLQRCLNYKDNIAAQLWTEARLALDDHMCLDLADLQMEVQHLHGKEQRNIFVRWAYLASFCNVGLEWSRMPDKGEGMSWAEVLRPIRNADVEWSVDAARLRRVARRLHDAGERDVTGLPSFEGALSIPRMRGVSERDRSRLERWVRRTVSVPLPATEQAQRPVAAGKRTRIETLAAVRGMVDSEADFTRHAMESVIDSMQIVMEENGGWMADVMDALASTTISSWQNIVDLTKNALFPMETAPAQVRVRFDETAGWFQFGRYSKLLYQRITGVRRHASNRGWLFRCELSGRTGLEGQRLVDMSDRMLGDALVREQRALLLPADWWPDLDPPTPWGWWVLPVEVKRGGVLVCSMERSAIDEGRTYLSLRGECSVEEALLSETGDSAPERWISLEDMGFSFGLARKAGRPRFGGGQDLPPQVHDYLKRHGPIRGSDLLPTPGIKQNWRGLKGSVHHSVRKRATVMRQVVEEDTLSDTSVINDTSRLLEYHLRRFKRARYVPLRHAVVAPKTIGDRPGVPGVNVETHSYMDESPPRLDGALVSVLSHSVRYTETVGELTGESYQGVTHVSAGTEKWKLDGMRWHQLLKAGSICTGSEFRKHVDSVQSAEKRGYRTLTWEAMHHLTSTFQLTHSYGEPLFSSYPGLTPLTDQNEATASSGQRRGWLFVDSIHPEKVEGWVRKMVSEGGGIVAATTQLNLKKETMKFLTASSNDHFVALLKTGALRVKGWWQDGDTKTARKSQRMHFWLLLPVSERPGFSRSKRWLESMLHNQLYPLATSGPGRTYWEGSEAGRLGLYDGKMTLLASDGSAGERSLGAGFTLRMGGEVTDWDGCVEGGDEQITSFRPEAAGLGAGVKRVPLDEPLAMLVDNESLLKVIEAWIGSSHHPSPLAISDFDLVAELVGDLQRRTAPTFLYKVKSHRGEPFNTRADTLADRGVHNLSTTIERRAGARIRYRVDGYFGVWCRKVQCHAESHAAKRLAGRPELGKGVLDKFLRRPDMGRQFLGNWLSRRSKRSDADQKCAIQVISDTFPTPANLNRWGMKPNGVCDECGYAWGSIGHIQGHCSATKPARIACHNRCREVVTDTIRNAKTGWKTYPETSCEDSIRVLHRLTGIVLPSMPTTSFLDPKTEAWRTLTWDEAKHFRVDELAIQSDLKCLWYNEMTRAWDRADHFDDRKDEFKAAWYRPWIDHLKAHLEPRGWTVRQLNFTVGARGSIPMWTWSAFFNLYGVRPTKQMEAFQKVADALLDGAIEIMQAYRAHARVRIANAASK